MLPFNGHMKLTHQNFESSSGLSKVHHKGKERSANTGPPRTPGNSAAPNNTNSNQRARVTVQRRANTKQKVVSLSFDQAVELTDSKAAPRAQVACAAPHIEPDQEGKASIKHDPSTDKDECQLPSLIPNDIVVDSATVVPSSDVLHLAPEDECTVDNGVSQAEPEVDSATTVDTIDIQHIAPPPMRLRQAWASPGTQPRNKQKASMVKTTATNTNAGKRRKSKQEETVVAGCSDADGDGVPTLSDAITPLSPDAQDEPEWKVGEIDEETDLDLDPIAGRYTPASNHIGERLVDNPDQKKSMKVELPTDLSVTDAKRLTEHDVSKESTEATGVKSKDIQPAEKSVEGGDLKRQGRGDGAHVKVRTPGHVSTPESTTENVDPTDTPNDQDTCEVSTSKNNKTKKKTSFFSWRPFKKKSSSKSKKEAKEVASCPHADKTNGDGDVTRPTMTSDILCTQGAVAIPKSLTDMFAANKTKQSDKEAKIEPEVGLPTIKSKSRK